MLMQFTDSDFRETEHMAELIKFCDTADIRTLEQITEEIYRHQPFLISLFLGYKDDIDAIQLDEFLRILIIIWLFFRNAQSVKRTPITEKMYEARAKKNIQFLQYLDGEPQGKTKGKTTDINLGILQSKALFTALLFKIKEGPALKKLIPESSAIMLLALKSLIECFEEIIKPE